mmetsp:Transcript_61767/g.144904  ORF Transcript_61767/g.144904 Transcript_61767/m.144904 type:complete len:566 (-) Transcript_61767:94-1791(-)
MPSPLPGPSPAPTVKAAPVVNRSVQLPPGASVSVVSTGPIPGYTVAPRVVLPVGTAAVASPLKAGPAPANYRPVLPFPGAAYPYPSAVPKAAPAPIGLQCVSPKLPSKSSEVSLSELSTEAKTDSPLAPRVLAEAPQPQDVTPAMSTSPLSKITKGLSSGGLSPTASGATPTTASKSSVPRTPSKRCHIRSDSVQWTQLERDLFESSSGAYHSTEMAQMRRLPSRAVLIGGTGVNFEVPGRVSIVAPSMSKRQHYHENLWRCFEAQTWADKELIVVETYEDQPSKFLQQKAMADERIVHITMKVQPGKDFTVGLKRNMTLHMATGEYIVNFDDDDLYAPGYVTKMVSLMQKERLVGVTLSAWYNYYIGKGVCTFSDPESWDEWVDEAAELDDILYGYGFSYTHRRQAALLFPYPNVGFAEDAPFFLKLREVYGDDKVLLHKDTEGLCLHIMHRANSAQVLGSRTVSAQEIASLAVACLTPFQKMIDDDFFRFSPWRPPVRLPALSEAVSVATEEEAAIKEEAGDVLPKLRASTLEGPGGFDLSTNPPMRPRADSFRNSECSVVEM